MRLHKITTGIAAVLALIAAIVGIPALLLAIGAAPTSVPSVGHVHHALFVQDQNVAAVFAVLAAVVWFCWAAFTLSTLREIVAAIATHGRGSARPLPRMEWVGRPAAQLVAAVVLVFVSAPGLISATAPTAAAAPVVATARSATSTPASRPVDKTPSAANHSAATSTPAAHPAPDRAGAANNTTGRQQPKRATYTVRRRDTLWSIAGTQLGDPMRWPELAQMNPGVVGPAPDFLIRAGSTLAVGGSLAQGLGTTSEQVLVVQEGDTLSGIAARHGAGDWHALWSVNQDRPEPGAAILSNPNHIEPGWNLAAPTVSRSCAPPAAKLPSVAPAGKPAAQPHPAAQGAVGSQDLPPHHLAATAKGDKPDIFEGPQTRRVVPQTSDSGTVPVGGLTPNTPNTPNIQHTPQGVVFQFGAFATGGSLLAGAVLGALMVARRRQSRNRRPGRTIATTAPELIPLERAVVSTGRPGLVTAGFLDTALRSLTAASAAEPDGRLPDVIAVRHGGGQLNLRLSAAHPAPALAPWTVDESGLWWSISTEQELPVTQANATSYLAPLPTLAAIGSDAEGYDWLLDLERAGAIALTGDPDRCLDLARFLAAELSVNTWSDHLSVTMVGFGQEVVGLNPARLRYSGDLDAAVVALTVDAGEAADACVQTGMDVRTGRVRDMCADTFMPQVLLVAPHISDEGDKLAGLLEIMATHPGRAAMAVVLAGEGAFTEQAGWTLELTKAGRLIVPELGLDLTANQLSSDEAAGLSQMLSQAAEAADEPMPAAAGDQPWQAYCDAAGSLLAEHTLPRSAPGESPGTVDQQPATSLLPLPDKSYLDAGATTAEDLATLAPRVPATVGPVVLEADPSLDQDVAAWLDPDTDLPRLSLLGPVALRAHGPLEKNRVGFYTEIVAFLATRENGATSAQFETAFNLAPARARSDIRIARNWLGVNPCTGSKHLPDALRSKSGQARGIGVYELEGVLVDADLFRRLRVRGEARGADGIADLAMALSLVSGAPFDQLRADGYEWLTEGARIDQHLVCAIVDVAHVVTTHSLATGDNAAARAAAQLAQLAAPYEEIPRLDLVAVRAAEGHLEGSETYLRDQVCNRSDDGGAPEDLSERTQAILRHRQWLTRAG